MRLLRIIKDKDFPIDESTLETREASRAILFDEQQAIPLLFTVKHNFHKLPGGGIDPGESQTDALIREVMEEVGSEIEVTGEVGEIVEYRSQFNLKQTSYCYLGKIISKGSPNFTEEELNDGFKLEWLSIDEAISRIMNDQPTNYEGPFIQERDLLFLKTAKQITQRYKHENRGIINI
jgi:8-oxo-dGTP pyrophosphatase MutT (NUDIX family)